MLRTAKLLHPASDPAFRPTPGASLPGTLASPRTGLGPAGRRELVARLRHGCSFALMAPRAAGRTGFSWDPTDLRAIFGSLFRRAQWRSPRHLEPSLTAPSQTALSSPLDPLATIPSSPDSVGGTPAAGTDWGAIAQDVAGVRHRSMLLLST